MTDEPFEFVDGGRSLMQRPEAPATGTGAPQLYSDPRSVAELLTDPAFFRVLAKGLVFIQDRRAWSERLLLAMENHAGSEGLGTRRVTAQAARYDELREQIAVTARRGRRRREIVVLDAAGTCGELPELIEATHERFPHNTGLWVRAHVRDVPPRCLQLFDIVFLFDMAWNELEAVRTALPVSDQNVAELRQRDPGGRGRNAEPVLVFMARDADQDAELPLLVRNPALVTLHLSERLEKVSVDGYVPIIVEAVKFMFDRLGKRLDRSDDPPHAHDDVLLPIGPDALGDFVSSPRKYLVETVQLQTASLLEAELRSLMRRIDDRARLISLRAEKSVLAGAEEQAKLELQNERAEDKQADDWGRLSEILQGVIVRRE